MFCHLGQSIQSLTKLSVFHISECPALLCTPFENQSSQVHLITLKVIYFPYYSKNEDASSTDIERYSVYKPKHL